VTKCAQILAGAAASALTQFALLVAAGVTAPLQLAAGIAGAVGMGIALHLKPLPKRPWSEQERARKLNGEQP